MMLDSGLSCSFLIIIVTVHSQAALTDMDDRMSYFINTL